MKNLKIKDRSIFAGLVLFLFVVGTLSAQTFDPETGEPIIPKEEESLEFDQETRELIPEKPDTLHFDPETGEIIKEVQYDPETGELIKSDKETVEKNVLILLKSGDSITGIIESETDSEITLLSNTLGRLTLDKVNVRSIQPFSGVSVSHFPSTSRVPPIYFSVVAHAEQAANNAVNQGANVLGGLAGCIGTMFFGIGMPLVALAVETNAGMKQPDSNFYKELDSASKSIYDKTYSREYKELRRKYVYGTWGTACGLFFLMMMSDF
jgi:hypothetical protein